MYYKTKRNTYCAVLVLLLSIETNIHAQLLTAEQAVAIAIENNFGIKVKRNQVKQLDVNNTAGAAGMLPAVTAGATKTYNINNTELNFFSGESRKVDGAKSNALAADVTLRWTVFDGLQMFAHRDYLNHISKSGNASLNADVEQMVVTVLTKHAEIVLLKKYITSLEENIKLSATRKNIADKKKQIGSGSALSLNQSVVDLINDSSNLITQQITYNKAIADLNTLMALPPSNTILIDTTILLIKNIAYDTLLNAALNQNSNLQVARYNKQAASDMLRMQQALRMPMVNVFGGMAYNQSKAEIGLLEKSRNTGVNYGASIAIPIFDGSQINRQIAISKLEAFNADLLVQNKILHVQSQFRQAVIEHEGLLIILRLNQQNVTVAKSNAAIALEQYRNGTITDIDFRATQQKAIAAESDLMAAIYKLKVAECTLLQLSGQLL